MFIQIYLAGGSTLCSCGCVAPFSYSKVVGQGLCVCTLCLIAYTYSVLQFHQQQDKMQQLPVPYSVAADMCDATAAAIKNLCRLQKNIKAMQKLHIGYPLVCPAWCRHTQLPHIVYHLPGK